MRYLITFALLLILAAPAMAQETYILIVNESVDVSKLSKKELKKIYRGKMKMWSKDLDIRPCYANVNTKTGKVFFKKLLKISPAKFKKYWLRMVFSGSGAAPVSLGNVESIIDFVSKNPGGMGIIPASYKDKLKGVRIVGLSG